jgi:tetratricopeptide (TPR) repeat protein
VLVEVLLRFEGWVMVREPQKFSQRKFVRVRRRTGEIALAAFLAFSAGVAQADRDGASATADAPPEAVAVEQMGPTEGERQIAEASYEIRMAELATDEDERRAAYARALEHAKRAVELEPESADAHFVAFASEGRLAQLDGLATAALKLVALNRQLDEVLRLDPNHANALAARGGMLMKLPRLLGGDPDEGLVLLERAVSLDEEALGKRLELAEAYHLMKREADARRVAEEALKEAHRRRDPREIERTNRFISQLAEACSGCALAAIDP